jgi:hypothetical protein
VPHLGARASGQVWHLPGPPTGTTRAPLGLVAAEAGHPVGIRSLPKLAVRGLGLVNPMLRELAETRYQFDEPFVLDITKGEPVFGRAGTPLAEWPVGKRPVRPCPQLWYLVSRNLLLVSGCRRSVKRTNEAGDPPRPALIVRGRHGCGVCIH